MKYILIVLLLGIGCKNNAGEWHVLEKNLSYLGFTAGKTSMKKIFNFFGKGETSLPKHKHDLSRICYLNPQNNLVIEFYTGYLHDYDTLSGFKVQKENLSSRNCFETDKLDLKALIAENFNFSSRKEDLIQELGKPKEEGKTKLVWEINHHEKFKKPKITKDFVDNGIVKQDYYYLGIYHGAQITAMFEKLELVSYEVSYYGEADFTLKETYRY